MVELNLRKILLDELKAANAMLAKYENRLLDDVTEIPVESDDKLKFYKERVNYWSTVSQELRTELFSTRTEIKQI